MVDFFGVPRDARPDLGAHEYSAPRLDAGTGSDAGSPDAGLEDAGLVVPEDAAGSDGGASRADASSSDAGGEVCGASGCTGADCSCSAPGGESHTTGPAPILVSLTLFLWLFVRRKRDGSASAT